MQLKLDYSLCEEYKSNTQKMRVATEKWVEQNMFCPICGRPYLHHYTANKPVADFCCEECKNDFELKSKNQDSLGKIINDGAYDTMMTRLNDLHNPNFLFMTHIDEYINNFILIPNHFFTPEIIIKRKPLSDNARRAGWVGCNINIADIPQSGKIFIVKDGKEIDRNKVIDDYARIKELKNNSLASRGWMLDVLSCVERAKEDVFSLKEMYEFCDELQEKHRDNAHVKDKIRQQLQFLRDKGLIEFLERGVYRRL